MNYHIYCKQKNITTNHLNTLKEFEKRLSAYCNITLHLSDTLTFPKELHLGNHDFLFIKRGLSDYSSEEFASFIDKIQHGGKSTLHVLIGYEMADFYQAFSTYASLLTPTMLSLTNANLSLATLTILFYEQLYRGYTILQGKTYHK